MSTCAERRQASKLYWLVRGRADGVVAVGRQLNWTAAQIYRIAKSVGVEHADAREAMRRATDCERP